MAQLPRRYAGGRVRGRGIQLPGAEDVAQARIPTDPGLDFRQVRAAFSTDTGLEDATAGFEDFAANVQRAAERQQKRLDATKITEAELAFDQAASEEYRRRSTEDDPARPDFMSDYRNWMGVTVDRQGAVTLGGRAQEIFDSLPAEVSREARDVLRLRLARSSMGYADQAGRLQIEAGQKAAADAIDARSSQWAAQALSNPDSLPDILDDMDEGLGLFADTLTPDQERTARETATGSAVRATIQGLMDQERFADARAVVRDEGGYGDLLKADERVRLAKVIDDREEQLRKEREREAKARQAEERARWLVGYQDYVAYLRDGGTPDAETRFTPEQAVSVLGPEDGVAAAGELRRAEAFGQTMSTVRFASPDELGAIMQREMGDLSSPEDFRANREEVSTLVQAVNRRNKELQDDPAAFVAQSPAVMDSYARMQTVLADEAAPADQVRAATEAYAEASLAEQARLGVAPEDRTVTTTEMRRAIARSFNLQQGQGAVQSMRAEAERWGQNWPTVLAEINKDLPGTALTLSAMDTPAQQRAAEELAEAAKDGAKVYEERLASADKDALRQQVSQAMQPFELTVMDNPGGMRTASTIRADVELLAMRYMTQGDPANTAVQRAAQDILGRYEFVGSFRVPVEVDADLVATGAAEMQKNLGEFDVVVPRSLMGLPPDEAKEQYLSALASNGYWVTAPDERGLVLYEGTTRSAVMLDNGQPLTVPWRDLTTAGALAMPPIGAVVP